tara:strand:- start:56 stop:538 length:483 start_codon:yes stop_codon:yes gene_type:complete
MPKTIPVRAGKEHMRTPAKPHDPTSIPAVSKESLGSIQSKKMKLGLLDRVVENERQLRSYVQKQHETSYGLEVSDTGKLQLKGKGKAKLPPESAPGSLNQYLYKAQKVRSKAVRPYAVKVGAPPVPNSPGLEGGGSGSRITHAIVLDTPRRNASSRQPTF